MIDAVSVLTCPKRPQYLLLTLRQLDFAGATSRIRLVFSDGGPPPTCPGWIVSPDWAGPRGPRAAMWRVFKTAAALKVDRLLYCEDDLLVSPGAVTRAFATPIREDQALVSFFDSKEFPGAAIASPGVHDVPVMGRDRRGLFGACCMLFPGRTLAWLASRPHDGWDDPWQGDPDPADLLLGWALKGSPWPLRGVHVPSLVDHAGKISSMGHNAAPAALFAGVL